MFVSKSQNLPALAEYSAAADGTATAQLPPVSNHLLVRRAKHFAWSVQFSLAEPEAMHRLHGATAVLRDAASVDTLLPRVLDGALALMAADFGHIQLLDPATGQLTVVTQSGLGPELLHHLATTHHRNSAARPAMDAGTQTVIADVNTDVGFAPHRDMAARAGFRAVQSTFMSDHPGRLIGTISTYHRQPCRPLSTDLGIMALYADFAGQIIARRLGGLAASHDPGDLIGQATISALLSPRASPPGTTVNGSADRDLYQQHAPAVGSAALDETLGHFATDVVNRLFSIGLSLESARGIAGPGAAGDWIVAATAELDDAIRDIRSTVFHLMEDRNVPRPGHIPDRARYYGQP